VFDVATGAIDHDAARAWRDYDISHKLLTGWDALAPQLDGKIRIYAGELDTFYLEGAVERFQALAREAGLLEHMVVEVVPGMVHTLHQPGQEDMLRTIAERWARRAEPVGSH
jgi:dienelactone hydrolase